MELFTQDGNRPTDFLDDVALAVTAHAAANPALDMARFMDGLAYTGNSVVVRAPKKTCYAFKDCLTTEEGNTYIQINGTPYNFTISPEVLSPQKRTSVHSVDSQAPVARVMMFLNPKTPEFRIHQNAIVRGWTEIGFTVQRQSRMEAKHDDTRLGKDYKRNECSLELVLPPKKDWVDQPYNPFPHYLKVSDTIDGNKKDFKLKYSTVSTGH